MAPGIVDSRTAFPDRDWDRLRPVEFCAAAAAVAAAAVEAQLVVVVVAVIVVEVGPQLAPDVHKTVHLVLVAVESCVPSLRGSVIPILE